MQLPALARAQRWFEKYGARSVLIGRLMPVIRTFISLPAGYAKNGARPVWVVYGGRPHTVDRGAGDGWLRGGRELASRDRSGTECGDT